MTHLDTLLLLQRPFFKNLWIQEKGWDDQLKDEDIETWQKIKAEMKELSTISVPRHTRSENPQLLFFVIHQRKHTRLAFT